MASDDLIDFQGSHFCDPLARICELVSEKHMGVCTKERPVMHWVSVPYISMYRLWEKMNVARCTCDGILVFLSTLCVSKSFFSNSRVDRNFEKKNNLFLLTKSIFCHVAYSFVLKKWNKLIETIDLAFGLKSC